MVLISSTFFYSPSNPDIPEKDGRRLFAKVPVFRWRTSPGPTALRDLVIWWSVVCCISELGSFILQSPPALSEGLWHHLHMWDMSVFVTFHSAHPYPLPPLRSTDPHPSAAFYSPPLSISDVFLLGQPNSAMPSILGEMLSKQLKCRSCGLFFFK